MAFRQFEDASCCFATQTSLAMFGSLCRFLHEPNGGFQQLFFVFHRVNRGTAHDSEDELFGGAVSMSGDVVQNQFGAGVQNFVIGDEQVSGSCRRVKLAELAFVSSHAHAWLPGVDEEFFELQIEVG